MPVVASATLEVTPVLSGAQQSLTEQLTGAASSAGESAGKEGGSKFSGSLVKNIAAGSVAVAGAVAGVGAALVGTAGKTAEYGDQIDKASQKLGVSASFYQEWDAVLRHSGTSMDGMSATFKKLATASQGASKDQQAAFEALGMSMEQVQSMSAEDLFANVISGLQGMEEGTERTALATTLLGKGAMEMGALLNTSSEDTQGMIDKVHKLGGVMSDDAVKASAQYQDSLMDMKASFKGLGNGLMVDLLPTMSGFMEKITEFVSTADLSPITDTLGGAVSALGEFIQGLDVEAVGTVFQNVVSGIGQAVSLAWGVIQQVFGAVQTGIGTVTAALEGSGASWDDVWGGISAIVGTAAGLISTAVQTIASIIAWLVSEAQTDGSLINTVWTSITTAIEAAVSIIQDTLDMVTALLNGDWSSAWESAESIVDTCTRAISSILSNTWSFISSAATAAWSGIRNAISSVWTSLVSTAKSAFESCKNAVMAPINVLRTMLSNAWNSIRSTASSVWSNIRNAMTSPITAAKNTISGIISTIRGMFPLSIGNIFSNLKLPHISVSGGEAPFGIGGLGRLPSFSVQWYARAAEYGARFTDPTIIGVGDADQPEILIGEDKLRELVGGKGVTNYITVNGAEDPEAWAMKFARQMKIEMRMA